MKKLAWQSALLAGTIILLSIFFRIRLNNTYTAYLPEMASEQEQAPDQNSGQSPDQNSGEAPDQNSGQKPDQAQNIGASNSSGADTKPGGEEGASKGEGASREGTDPSGTGEEGAPEDINFDVHVRNMENETGGIAVEETMGQGDMPAMAVEAQEAGEYTARIMNEAGETVARRRYYVDRFHNVFDFSTGGFTGDLIVMSAITIFLLIESILMLRTFLKAKGPDFYAYSTIHLAGISLFLLQIGIGMLVMTVRHQLDPAGYTMNYVYDMLSSASLYFILLTSPFILVFSVAMTVSNIALIRHEGKRRRNFLGILISVLMIIGMILAFVVFAHRTAEGVDPAHMSDRMILTFQNVCATAYVYFECMLIGAIICGLIAANHVPARNCSHIVILGCGFRKDGTLPPLLRGRVDKAIEFWNRQKEEHKPQAVFVPSGGQGPGECMPEAEAMRNYLLSKGIPEDSIHPEMKSRNTYQNMSFSKEMIEEEASDAKVVFSTTNYHVFRSGVWASLAGLRAEGIGSDTKWWFWPNAFMRECVGLLANRWKQEIILMMIMMGIFTVLSLLL